MNWKFRKYEKSNFVFFIVGTLISCSNDDNISDSNELVGSWRLQKIVTFPGDVYNFDESESVVYSFNEDMNLVIESNVQLEDFLSPFVTSQTASYSFYYEEVLYEDTVVKLENNSNLLGVFYFSKDGNVLTLSEYDGSLLTFVKIQ